MQGQQDSPETLLLTVETRMHSRTLYDLSTPRLLPRTCAETGTTQWRGLRCRSDSARASLWAGGKGEGKRQDRGILSLNVWSSAEAEVRPHTTRCSDLWQELPVATQHPLP